MKYNVEINNEVNGVKLPGFGIIKIFDDKGNLIDVSATKSKRDFSQAEVIEDMLRKIVTMVLSADSTVINTDQAIKILQLIGISLEMDGKKLL